VTTSVFSNSSPRKSLTVSTCATSTREAQHRDPNKVAEALLKGANGIYKLRGERGGFRDAWSWLGDMLQDASGLSGSFYQDKKLDSLKDELSKIDFDLGMVASGMQAAAKRIKKEHAENEKKKRG